MKNPKMKILIIYATTEGQTRKIARFMEEQLQAEGHPVVIAEVTDAPPSPEDFDMVLIGSSIHMHQYHKAVKQYVISNLDTLNNMKSHFFSVCMAVASDIPEEHEEAAKIASDFLEDTGWNTDTPKQFAGALKYTQYDFFKKLIMRMIAKKEGGSTDTSQDHEYTDWGEVKKYVLGLVS